MNKYVKKSLKITGIVVGVAAVIYLFICIIFYFATKPMSDSIKQTNDIALQKTPITTITKNYHLSRSVESNSLVGTSKKGKKYYFIYLPHSKKAYLYQASKGKSDEQIKEIFNDAHPGHSKVKCELGWYKGVPVWEITYKKENGNYGYVIYDFKTGKELVYADNL
ncbi:PepSY domain-containing protein [Lactobacillus taiwanensis]|uniref:PepSY domain-containing protein n=1 Tax=Lactobacillus taiwanensis TaxID=508451 RepID=UPI000B996EBC|nr:PepSY domain-containing protein [Lactobacillus taiwanensis]OYR93048.1 hypothetical protein CBF59_02300 [Lactobacillus taiwanensis]